MYTINRRSIEEVKAKIKQKARDNIAEKVRLIYGTNNLDPNIDRRIYEEVEARVSMFTDDLDREIETKIETHKELFSDLT